MLKTHFSMTLAAFHPGNVAQSDATCAWKRSDDSSPHPLRPRLCPASSVAKRPRERSGPPICRPGGTNEKMKTFNVSDTIADTIAIF